MDGDRVELRSMAIVAPPGAAFVEQVIEDVNGPLKLDLDRRRTEINFGRRARPLTVGARWAIILYLDLSRAKRQDEIAIELAFRIMGEQERDATVRIARSVPA